MPRLQGERSNRGVLLLLLVVLILGLVLALASTDMLHGLLG